MTQAVARSVDARRTKHPRRTLSLSSCPSRSAYPATLSSAKGKLCAAAGGRTPLNSRPPMPTNTLDGSGPLQRHQTGTARLARAPAEPDVLSAGERTGLHAHVWLTTSCSSSRSSASHSEGLSIRLRPHTPGCLRVPRTSPFLEWSSRRVVPPACHRAPGHSEQQARIQGCTVGAPERAAQRGDAAEAGAAQHPLGGAVAQQVGARGPGQHLARQALQVAPHASARPAGRVLAEPACARQVTRPRRRCVPWPSA